MVRAARAEHDRGHVRVGEQPGEGECGRRRPALAWPSARTPRARRRLVRSCCRCRYGSGRRVMREPAGGSSPRPVLAGQPAARERAERRVGDALARADLEHAVVLAVEQRVGVLDDGRPSAPRPRRVDVAAAPGADRARALKLVERGRDLLDRRVRSPSRGRGRRRPARRRAARGSSRSGGGSARARGRGRRPSLIGLKVFVGDGPHAALSGASCRRTSRCDRRRTRPRCRRR